MSAIVIGASRTRIALAVVRGLAAKGVAVFTADSMRLTRCGLSGYSSGNFSYTSPFENKEKFAEDLMRLVDKTGAKVVFPVHDELYYFVAENREALKGLTFIPLPDYEMIRRVKNKDALMGLSKELDMPIPESRLLDSIDALQESLDRLGFPAIIKSLDKDSGKGMHFLEDRKDVLRHISVLRERLENEKLLIQKYINGDYFGMASICQDGRHMCSISYRQIHQYPVRGGTPTLMETCTRQDIIEIMDRMYAGLRWQGLCQADFVIERGTEKAYLLDINPRPFGALSLVISAGLNLPYYLYKMALEEDFEIDTPEEGVKGLWFEGEVMRIIDCLKNRKNLKELKRLAELSHIDVIEDFARGDFMPFLLAPFCLIYRYYLSGR